MKKIYKYILIFSMSLVVFSCDFDDTNLDPNSVSEDKVTLPLLLPKAEAQSAYNLGATSGRLAGIWMQYFRGIEAQQAALTNYSITESDVNNTWEFQLYTGSMRDCSVILAKSIDLEANHYAGIARVLLAQNLGFATQLWGDIPFSEAFLGSDNLKPAYDNQQAVFAGIQQLLDDAILNFAAPSNGFVPGSGDDLIFGGNMDNWLRTARSLKARYSLMLSKRNGNTSYSDALTQINAGVIDEVGNEPDFFFGTPQNDASPIALFESDRGGTLGVDPDFAESVMAGDPRAAAYFGNDGNRYTFAGSSLFWGKNNAPLPLISYTEVKFIESEARLMTGDIPGAETALQEAILASMAQVGVTGTAYATANSVLAGLSGNQARLDKIISEKYKALYVQGMAEIWSDYRRTGFPSFLTPEPGATINIIPRRMPYAQSERLTNSASLEAAVANQGGSDIDDDMWAFN